MRNRRPWTCLVLTAVALVGMCECLQTPAQGAVPVTCSADMNRNTDSDLDGLFDYEECYGIPLGGVIFPGKISNIATRADRLDPDSEDLFVVLVPRTGGYFQLLTNPLQYVSDPISAGGLQVAVHVINQSQVLSGTDRNVTASQKAVRVTESLDTSTPNLLGFSNTGIPNGLDLATIYTLRINNFIKSACGASYSTSKCADSTGVYDTVGANGNLALTKKYILHTIAHEVAHMLGPLAPAYNAKFGGYHYKSGTNVIMDQSVYYTSKSGTVTFYSGTKYTAADQNAVALH
jgi:hypothetical protein